MLEEPRLPGAGTDTASEIRAAQARLDELRRHYTDKHPDVIAAQQDLDDLKKRQQAEIAAIRRGDPAATAPTNPEYQAIRLQLRQAELEVAAAKSQVADQEAKVTELQKMIDTAPELEAELAQLKRDYDVNNARYAALQKERMGTARAVPLKVVQPPAAAYSPAWPRRKLWLAEILAGALAAGAALAYGLNYLFPVATSGDAIGRALGVPVLAKVTAAFPERERRAWRHDLLRISMVIACLFVAFGVAIVLSQSGYRLSIALLSSR